MTDPDHEAGAVPPDDPADRPTPAETLGRVLRHPLAWGAVGLAALLAMLMTLSYLGGFLDPVGHLKGLKIGVVDDDHTVVVAGQRVDAGARIVATLHDQPHREVRWVTYPSRAAAIADLRDDKLSGAIDLPRDLSSSIGAIGLARGKRHEARIDLLENQGAGLFQVQVLATVSSDLDQQVNAAANTDLVRVLSGLRVELDPAGARSIGHPVQIHEVAVVSNSGKTGRGLAPFYAAVMATLTGFLAASLSSISIDLLRGTEHLELLGKDLHLEAGSERPLVTWAAKSLVAVIGAALGGAVIAVTSVLVLGMRSAGTWKVGLLAALGASAISLITMVFLTLFGIGGELLGVLFTTIFGVPSALGVYPAEALPAFFKFTSSWHPMHFLTDGMRALVFFDGRARAGLGRAVAVLVAWWVGAALLGALSAWAIGRRPSLRVGGATRARAHRRGGHAAA